MIVVLGKGKSRSGGGKGIGDYYLYGTDGDRDKKDNRIVLSGNLDTLTKTIDVAHQMGYRETYRNIVLSFSEDYIEKEIMDNIVQDFKKQYMSGYSEEENEYVFYAEAHTPKFKIQKDEKTGGLIHRKPHIHITIPSYSPKLEKSLSLGNHGQRLKELKLWKKITEKKYGLHVVENSPIKKDITQARDTKLTSRKQVIEKFNEVIKDNIESKILDSHRLKMCLLENIKDIEYIKESTSKAKSPYFSIKLKNQEKSIRLKGDLFSFNHLIFSEARKRLIDKEIDNKYYEVGNPRKVPTTLQEQLDFYYKKRFDYVEKREFKVRKKFDVVENRIERVSNKFSAIEKARILKSTVKTNLNTKVDIKNARNIKDIRKISSLSIVHEKFGTLPKIKISNKIVLENELQSTIKELQNDIAIKNTTNRYRDYKKLLNPKLLFSTLKINKVKYSIFKLKNTKNIGEYRIKCGKRNLNINDFLTKEMHLSWQEAKELMDKAYQKQLDFDIKSKKFDTTTNYISYQNKIFFEVYAYKLEHSLKGFYITKKSNDVVQEIKLSLVAKIIKNKLL